METFEIMFNPISIVVIVFIAGLGLLASPFEVENDESEG
jgi:hypothetical protein